MRRCDYLMLVVLSLCLLPGALCAEPAATDEVQAQAILTVAEGKRLIAKAVTQLPVVRKALKDGMIIVGRGTTDTYVAEELTGKKIPHGSYVVGWTGPAKGGKPLPSTDKTDDIVIVNGAVQPISMDDALKQLKAGDVVIKGANALSEDHKLAGGLVGGGPGSSAGTVGKVLPLVVARKAHLIIPIGLEKKVSGDLVDIANKMRAPVESLNDVPSMFLMNGTIVTEIEALNLLTGVDIFEVAAGGVGGAEGSCRLLLRGPREKVQQALSLIESIQGEPPFSEQP